MLLSRVNLRLALIKFNKSYREESFILQTFRLIRNCLRHFLNSSFAIHTQLFYSPLLISVLS